MRNCAPTVVMASLCFGSALTPAPAAAEYTSSLGGNFNNPGSALIGTMIANRAIADAARREAPPAAARSDAASPSIGRREPPVWRRD
jgi:hypothetical protein